MNQVTRNSGVAAILWVSTVLALTGCADNYLAPETDCGLVVSAAKNVLLVGETTHLTAQYMSSGSVAYPCPLANASVLKFSTSNAAIVSISDGYDAVGISAGTAMISIANGSVISAPVSIKVVAP